MKTMEKVSLQQQKRKNTSVKNVTKPFGTNQILIATLEEFMKEKEI